MENSQKRLQKLLKFNDKSYAFDIERICDFVNEKSMVPLKETEILENFDYSAEKDKTLSSRNVRELNSPGNGQESIIYDLLKMFVVQIIVFEGDGDMDAEDLPFGTKLAFNTLLKEGFLIEVNE